MRNRLQSSQSWIAVGAYSILALALIPLFGLYLAASAEPPLFASPPLDPVSVAWLLARTIALALGVSVISLSLGTWLAWCDTSYDFRGRRTLEIISILPLAIPSYLLAGVIREVMAPRGLVGGLIGSESSFSGFGAALIVLSISCTPYVQLLVRATLTELPGHLDEAARLLGASPWRRFCSLVIPILRPAWAFSLVIVAFYTISDFGAVAVLDCEVLTWALYQNRHTPRDVVTLGVVLMGVVIPTMIFIRWIQGQHRDAASIGVARPKARTLLSWPRQVGVYTSYALVVIPGLVIPVGAIIGWVSGGLSSGMQWHGLADQIGHTLYYTFIGAVATLIAALFMAWFVTRGGTSRGWVEYAVYLTSGLPGILIAVGIFYVLIQARSVTSSGSDFMLWFEGIGGFLFLGYLMRFLSEGYAALKPGIVALDPRVEEAAKTLGASSFKRFWLIVVPQVRPSIVAALILLVVAIAKELPITLLLTPLGEQTLAYRIFDAQQEGALPESGVSALLLLVMVFAVQVAVQRRRRDAH